MEKIKIYLKRIGIFKYYITLKKLFGATTTGHIEETPIEEKIAFFKEFIKKGELYFDVGANVGNRIIAIQHITDRIVAIEPQQECVAELEKQFGNTIQIEPIGLAAEEGISEMHIAEESTISSFSKDFIDSVKKTRFKHNKWNKTRSIKMTTLGKLIEKHGEPSFCKIDVEGYEFQVLQGLKKPLKYISFEYCVPEMQKSLNDCVNYLNSIDRTLLYNYSVGESMKLALINWLDYNSFSSLINEHSFINSQFGDIYVKR